MCTTCGCGDTKNHHHHHTGDAIKLEKAILETNDQYASLIAPIGLIRLII